MSAAVTNSQMFWGALIAVLAIGYALRVSLAIIRHAEDIALVVILNATTAAWPAALVPAGMPPRKDD